MLCLIFSFVDIALIILLCNKIPLAFDLKVQLQDYKYFESLLIIIWIGLVSPFLLYYILMCPFNIKLHIIQWHVSYYKEDITYYTVDSYIT